MKAILLAATILLSLAAQNPSHDKQAATDDQGAQSLQPNPPAQQSAPPTQGQQPPTPAQDSQGPNLVIEEVIFEGNNVFSSAELSRQLRRVSADVFLRAFGRRNVFTRERFQEDAARLMRYMTDRGYLNASVGEPKIRFINIADAARTTGDVPIRLIIPINEGPLHRLGKLTVRDGSVLRPEEARAQFPIKEGEVINASLMEAT